MKKFKIYMVHGGLYDITKMWVETKKVVEETEDFFIIEGHSQYGLVKPKGNWKKTKKEAMKLWVERKKKEVEEHFNFEIESAGKTRDEHIKKINKIIKKEKL